MDRQRLPTEQPAGHRIANCRIANVDELHNAPPDTRTCTDCHRGRLMINLSANTRKVNDPKVGLPCTEVMDKFPPIRSAKDIVIHV